MRGSRHEQGVVATSNASTYDEGNGKFFIMSPSVRRTFGTEGYAVEHATNYIRAGSDEFLIVKVVGRVRKKPIPVEYVRDDGQPAPDA